MVYVYTTRQAQLTLQEGSFPTVPRTVHTIYQGEGTAETWNLWVAVTATDVNKQRGAPFGIEDSTNYHQRANNMVYPWEDISEAVFIEIKDPAFMVDINKTTFYGYPATSPEVETSIVERNGRTFFKMNFAEGVYRNKVYMTGREQPVTADISRGWWANDKNSFRNYAAWHTPAGPIKLAFNTLPGTSVGIHNPVGDIFVDYSELIDKYNAPYATGYDSDRTDYIINGVTDDLGLTSTAATEPKLLKADGSAYAVNVVRAIAVGVELAPGKLNSLYDFNPRKTVFQPDENQKLNGLISLKAPANSDIFQMTSYIKIPRTNAPVESLGEDGSIQVSDSEYNMYLRSAPYIISESTGIQNNIHFYYTTDENPGETSNYSMEIPLDWSSVTGIKVVADKMPKESAINLRLDLKSDEKTQVGTTVAYSGGTYNYKPNEDSAIPNRGYITLAAWEYQDFLVTQPNALIFWDTNNEDGVKNGNGENAVANIKVELYDSDGTTLIDTATTNSSGNFVLHSYKNDAGQIIKVTMPTDAGTTVKMTKKSNEEIIKSGVDSDFDRKTNQLVLPKIISNGLPNISGGLVKLPIISATDVTVNIGETLMSTAMLTEFLGMSMPEDSYNITFETAEDTQIAKVDAQTFVITGTAAGQKRQTSVKGLKAGTTTAKVYTTNRLGDVVESVFNITVKMTYKTFTAQKVWDDNSNSLGVRPADVEIQLQRESVNETKHTAAVLTANEDNVWKVTFSNMPEYDSQGDEYTYSIIETSDVRLKNYTPVYSQEGNNFIVTNTLNPTSISGSKTWVENGTGFTRPDSIRINLYRSDAPNTVHKFIEIPKDENADVQEFTFSGLIKYAPDGAEYKYTVKEAEIPALYTEIHTGNHITNTYNVNTLVFEKNWDFTGAPAESRPSEVQVDLFLDDNLATPYKTVVIKGSENWKTVITVPALEIQGHTITVKERPIEDYEGSYLAPVVVGDNNSDAIKFNLSNTYVMPKVTVSGNKTWQNIYTGVVKPKVTVELARNGIATGIKADVDESGKYEFTNLDRYDSSGTEYIYTIKELYIAGYDSEISDPQIDNDTGNVTINLKNTYNPTPVTLDPPVKKVVVGEDAPAAELFTFIMEANGDAPMPADSTGLIKEVKAGAGAVEFGNISYSKPGVYSYKISEKAESTEGFTYDSTEFTLQVTVIDVKGTLQLTKKIDGISDKEAVFENIFVMPKGELIISKTVTGGGNENTLFTFKVLFSKDGNYTYTGSKEGFIKSGSIIQLKHGESIKVLIPRNVVYTVIEDAVSNYIPTPLDRTFTGTISDVPSHADFLNKYSEPYVPPIESLTGNLAISKTVTGDKADKNKEFSFTVKLNVPGRYSYVGSKTGTISSGETVKLKHGESITIVNIPASTEYSVYESGSKGYRVYASDSSGQIIANGTAHAKFTNIRSSMPNTGNKGYFMYGIMLIIVSVAGFIVTNITERRKNKGIFGK